MKKILVIFTGNMELGGIERSLLGLLDAIDYSQYEVDLFLYGHNGILYEQINNNVNILPEIASLATLRESLYMKIKRGCLYSAMLRIRDEVRARLGNEYNHDDSWRAIVERSVKQIEKEYDLALGFFVPFDILKKKVKAKVKVGWIHTDYCADSSDAQDLLNEYSGLDFIAAVSEQSADSFCKMVPQLKDRVLIIENSISINSLILDSEKFSVQSEMPDDGSVRLLSIGRFCEAKNFDNIPAICKLIRAQGVDVKWYIIGFGTDEEKIRTAIAKEHIEDFVIILGKKDNPYPYIKACDIYVQPSRYEGKCVAVIEAQILNKPVVITNYKSASSQLCDGFDGIIVPMDNQGCAKGIISLIQDSELRNYLCNNTKEKDYARQREVEKLFALIF